MAKVRIREWNRAGFLKLNCRCGGVGIHTTVLKNIDTREKVRHSFFEHDMGCLDDRDSYYPSETKFMAMFMEKHPDYVGRVDEVST